MKITKNEKQLLSAIVNSDYIDTADPVDIPIYLDILSEEMGGGTKFSGIMSSATQKGLIESDEDDNSVWITQKGWDAMQELSAEKVDNNIVEINKAKLLKTLEDYFTHKSKKAAEAADSAAKIQRYNNAAEYQKESEIYDDIAQNMMYEIEYFIKQSIGTASPTGK